MTDNFVDIYERLEWKVPADGEIEYNLGYFQANADIIGFDYNAIIWWNRRMSEAAYWYHWKELGRDRGEAAVALTELQQRFEAKDGREFFWSMVERPPRTESRCLVHLKYTIRHVLKSNADVSGNPFVAYNAKTGQWGQGATPFNHPAIMSAEDAATYIIDKFSTALSVAADLLVLCVDWVIPPRPKPVLVADGGTATQTEVDQWQDEQQQRASMLNQIRPIKEMAQAIPAAKYSSIKNSLRRELVTPQTAWDSDTRWLVLQDGVLNVDEIRETGAVYLHGFSPEHMSTMGLEVGLADALGDPGESEWYRGVRKVLPDAGVRTYLQKRFGAALLGRPGEVGKSLVWQHGVGDTAKSTLQECIAGARGVFAPYGLVSSSAALTVRGQQRGAGERFIAYARGKRFVLMSEIPDGEMMDQDIFKKVTGGETAEGTAKYANAVSYFFTATIFIASNHAPAFPPGDTAFAGRIHVVPFKHRLWVRSKNQAEWASATDDHRADEGWASRVLSDPQERAAILRWVLDGLVLFGREGLGDLPEEMVEAREDFALDADPVGMLVRSLLGTEPSYDGPAWIEILTDAEWERRGLLERDGVPIQRMEQLITTRARELGLIKPMEEDLSRKWKRAAMRMLHEVGGVKKKALLDPATKQTGYVYSRIREAVDWAALAVEEGAPHVESRASDE